MSVFIANCVTQPIAALGTAELPPRARDLDHLQQLHTLQMEAYETRLALQPNGADALRRFEQCRDTELHKTFQHAMTRGLWEDWTALGKDALLCLQTFGAKLQSGLLSVPKELGSGYLHGLSVHTTEDSAFTVALDPTAVTILNDIHHSRWKKERIAIGLIEQSLSQASVHKIDPTATDENHAGALCQRVPLLANCDRIGVLLQCGALARLSEVEFRDLVNQAVPGNPRSLPLRIIEGPGEYRMLTSELAEN